MEAPGRCPTRNSLKLGIYEATIYIHVHTNTTSLPSHRLSMLATNATCISHSLAIGYQCWPPVLHVPLTPLPLAINAGHKCYMLPLTHVHSIFT